MSNTKFKSGDKVVFCKSSLESGMIDAEEGDVFTVNGVYNRTVSLKELPGDYHKTHFEHYVERERVMEKKFAKVGDKIRIVHPTGSVGCYEAGDVLEVVDTHEDWVGVDVVIEDGGFFHVYHTEYEVIEEEIVLESNSRPQPEISHEDSRIDWQGSQINWQVGQEVWDTRYSIPGKVERVGELCLEVQFKFGVREYYKDGVQYGNSQHGVRSLFFSEPKIIAERMPPKKTFVPTLKFDDKVIVINEYGRVACYGYVEKESEYSVSMRSGEIFQKDYFSFHELGEQVKFS